MKFSIIAVSIMVALAVVPASTVQAKGGTLESSKINSNIVIDGNVDAIWEEAASITQKLNKLPYKPNNGYEGIKKKR